MRQNDMLLIKTAVDIGNPGVYLISKERMQKEGYSAI
jgi:hypothetical protein